MKKLNNLKWFSLGIAVCLMVTILVVPAFASTLTKTAQLVYNDIKITLNGGAVTPKDANGNAVEPFTIDGTTYLPVRAVANALGLGVNWDGATKTAALTSPSELMAAPASIFTTSTAANGYSEKLMYVKGTVTTITTSDDIGVILIKTDNGTLGLADSIGMSSFQNLKNGSTYTFTFIYADTDTTQNPIVPSGLYLSAK